ncbi:MAG: TetR/AcrR family transcriptional regulator [Desulfobacteraceae bacterium]|nr:TetR/AcrR family transcriptional regulator [Desulfobacteraceae bacterium]
MAKMKRIEKTQEKIIQAALELFVHKGYHGTSINNIMRKVGLTKAAYYAHFTSKGELFLLIIGEYKSRYTNELIRTGNECQGNALEKFHRIISFAARFALENQHLCMFLNYVTTELKADVDFEPVLRSLYKDFHKFITALIKQGIRQGIFRKNLDPEIAAYIFMALHDGVLHQWVLHRNYMDGVQYIRAFREIFLKGLVDQSSY